MIRAIGASRSAADRAAVRHLALSASARLPGGEDKLRAALRDQLDPEKLDGIISMHLIETIQCFPGQITTIPVSDPGSGDWFVLIDGTHVNAISASSRRPIGKTAHSNRP